MFVKGSKSSIVIKKGSLGLVVISNGGRSGKILKKHMRFVSKLRAFPPQKKLMDFLGLQEKWRKVLWILRKILEIWELFCIDTATFNGEVSDGVFGSTTTVPSWQTYKISKKTSIWVLNQK